MSILLDPADGPRPPGLSEVQRLRDALAASEECVSKLEARLSAMTGERDAEREISKKHEDKVYELECRIVAVHQHHLQSYQGHPPDSSVESRMWQVGFTDGLRAASVLLGGRDP